MNEKINFLKKVNLFYNVDEKHLSELLQHIKIDEIREGDIIIQEGNEDDSNFYQLVRGKVGVLKQGKKIAEITEPGEYFGEMACIMNEPRYASVVSIGRCKIKRYPGDKLVELIEKYPEIARKLFKTMAKRLRKTDNIVIQLAGGKRTPKPAIPPRMR